MKKYKMFLTFATLDNMTFVEPHIAKMFKTLLGG